MHDQYSVFKKLCKTVLENWQTFFTSDWIKERKNLAFCISIVKTINFIYFFLPQIGSDIQRKFRYMFFKNSKQQKKKKTNNKALAPFPLHKISYKKSEIIFSSHVENCFQITRSCPCYAMMILIQIYDLKITLRVFYNAICIWQWLLERAISMLSKMVHW